MWRSTEGANVPTRRMRLCGCLWPGGAHLWWRGSWPALALALAFSVLLNILLAATLVWTEWLPSDMLTTGWLVVAAIWIASAWVSWRCPETQEHAEAAGTVTPGDRLFREAQTQYLRGNWCEAETLLKQVLRKNRRDIDARLMLATLWRHTDRKDEALREIESLARTEAAGHWQQELEQLRTTIDSVDASAVDAA